MKASEKQHGGNHYASMPEGMQPWDVLKHWLTAEEYRGYQKGTAIVYLARERFKGGDTDIRKSAHHLERLIEEFAGAVESKPEAPAKPKSFGPWKQWDGKSFWCLPNNGRDLVITQMKDGSFGSPTEAALVAWNNPNIVAFSVLT